MNKTTLKVVGWAREWRNRSPAVVPRAGSRVATRVIPTCAPTSGPPAGALWRWFVTFVAVVETRRRCCAARRGWAGLPLLPAGTSAVLLGITFGFRVELVAVAVAQLALLPADLQSQLAHFLVALLLLLHLTLDPLSLSFLISFICERFWKLFHEISGNSEKFFKSRRLTLLVQQQLHFLLQLLPRIANRRPANRWLRHTHLEKRKTKVYIGSWRVQQKFHSGSEWKKKMKNASKRQEEEFPNFQDLKSNPIDPRFHFASSLNLTTDNCSL